MIPLRDDQPSFSTPFINYFLIAMNVLVFVWEFLIGAQSPRALNAFVDANSALFRGTPLPFSKGTRGRAATAILPIFTSMFLHASLMHVAGNMLFLWIFGDNVEDYLGHFKYLAFYLAFGIAAA